MNVLDMLAANEQSIGQLYHDYSVMFPEYGDFWEKLAKEEEVTLVIQVNGKVRDKVTVPVSITEAEAKELALSSERVKAYLKDKEAAKIIYVPQRLVNIVVG